MRAHNFSVKDKLWVKSAVGAVAGAICGFFGGGGGMVVVPLLIYALSYDGKSAHATAIAVILPVALFAAAALLMKALPDDIISLIVITSSVTVGGAIGSFLLKVSPPKVVGYIFAVLTCAAGLKMLLF